MNVTDNDFQEKVVETSKKKLVVVDFWATWCAPCQILAPVIERVVESYGDRVELAKIDIDENPGKAGEYSVDVIPSVKLFKDGKVVAGFKGAQPEEIIREIIDGTL